MEKTLDRKLRGFRESPTSREFILADAKDPDMAWGIASPGARWPADPDKPPVSINEFIAQAREIVRQGLVDILLASVSTMSILAHREHLFAHSPVTPAIRANDTTDIWLARGSSYRHSPSRPFATADLDEAQNGKLAGAANSGPAVNLGLYSITFNNDAVRDRESLEAFKAFRRACAERHFRYFLEVFAPNAPTDLAPEQVPGFLNDQIVRSLAGVSREHWPIFLKVPYFGPRWMEELAGYDSELVVGILGGASGTSRDAFQLIHEAKSHGARAALFGRKIKDAEHPLSFVRLLRAVCDDQLQPTEAVRAYHAELEKLKIPTKRPFAADLEITAPELRE